MWFWYSLIASILWGLDYTLAGKLLGKISFPLLLALEFLCGFLLMFGIVLFTGSWKVDIPKLYFSTHSVVMLTIMIGAFIAAHVCIVLSIGDKNATLASLIEMSYPLFVVLFSWLLFREESMSSGTAFGAVLVLAGVSVIYFLNK